MKNYGKDLKGCDIIVISNRGTNQRDYLIIKNGNNYELHSLPLFSNDINSGTEVLKSSSKDCIISCLESFKNQKFDYVLFSTINGLINDLKDC